MRFFERFRTYGLTVLAATLLLAGCGSNGSDSVFINNPPIIGGPTPAPPAAVNDSYNSLGNVLLKVTATDGVLNNDTLNNGQVSGFDAVSASGGTVTLSADGSFNYQPPNNTTGITDTFTYTLTNDGGTSTATVSIALTNLGRFVSNTAAPGGNGTEAAPFTTIQAGIDASNSGDTVFVKSSINPYAENIVLAGGVTVQGEGAGFTIDNGLAREIRPSVVLPEGDAPILQGNATMASNSNLSGMQILPGANPAILGMNVSDITVTDNEIVGATNGVDLTEVGGTVTVNGNQFVSILGNAINLINGPTAGNLVCNNNVFFNGPGIYSTYAIFAQSTLGTLTVSADGNTSTGDLTNGYDRFCEINATGPGSENGSLTFTNNNIFALKEAVVSRQDSGGNYEIFGNEILGGCTIFLKSNNPSASPFRCVVEGNVVRQLVGFAGAIFETKPGGPSEITVRNNQFQVENITAMGRQGTLVFSDNDVISGSPVVAFATDTSGTTLVTCRNNTIPPAGVLAVGSDLAVNVCAAVSGNSATRINLDELGTGELSVEGLNAPEGGPLSTLNNGAMITLFGSPTSVAVGSCGI
jgi:Bacterial Ig domain